MDKNLKNLIINKKVFKLVLETAFMYYTPTFYGIYKFSKYFI